MISLPPAVVASLLGLDAERPFDVDALQLYFLRHPQLTDHRQQVTRDRLVITRWRDGESLCWAIARNGEIADAVLFATGQTSESERDHDINRALAASRGYPVVG